MPSGFEYFGTHHMPLTAGSFTSSSTMSISGPVGVMGIVIISKPNDCVILKWRS